ncbi:hypothetical protein [Massilia sp. Root1485]|uniref:hypothetical protein n=1 Tax=Massilia sp. Root1485 TaxID=1736472 RepID=UPI0012E39D4E|nr:hypothetical protein [Massilia sp. Root1485]
MQRRKTLLGKSARTLVAVVLSALFVTLLLASRVLVPVLRVMATAGLVIFGFCALIRRDQVVAMWAGAGLAVGSVALEVALGAVVRALAPSGVVVISEV